MLSKTATSRIKISRKKQAKWIPIVEREVFSSFLSMFYTSTIHLRGFFKFPIHVLHFYNPTERFFSSFLSMFYTSTIQLRGFFKFPPHVLHFYNPPERFFQVSSPCSTLLQST